MIDFDEILETLDPSGEWVSDGYGIDSNLVHDPCGTMIEQDCPRCPECGARNPISALLCQGKTP